MFVSTPEFIRAEVAYRRGVARSAWRPAGRRPRLRRPRPEQPQPR
ncbi:MAG: hypothetical protein ACTHMS_05480 [Jatrophihabitans sp.]